MTRIKTLLRSMGDIVRRMMCVVFCVSAISFPTSCVYTSDEYQTRAKALQAAQQRGDFAYVQEYEAHAAFWKDIESKSSLNFENNHLWLGEAYEALGRKMEASKRYLALAKLYRSRKNSEMEQRYLRKAFATDPYNTEVLQRRREIYQSSANNRERHAVVVRMFDDEKVTVDGVEVQWDVVVGVIKSQLEIRGTKEVVVVLKGNESPDVMARLKQAAQSAGANVKSITAQTPAK